ncbi:hypothetical protein EJB05_12755, partial [Eragrostis curvula]
MEQQGGFPMGGNGVFPGGNAGGFNGQFHGDGRGHPNQAAGWQPMPGGGVHGAQQQWGFNPGVHPNQQLGGNFAPQQPGMGDQFGSHQPGAGGVPFGNHLMGGPPNGGFNPQFGGPNGNFSNPAMGFGGNCNAGQFSNQLQCHEMRHGSGPVGNDFDRSLNPGRGGAVGAGRGWPRQRGRGRERGRGRPDRAQQLRRGIMGQQSGGQVGAHTQQNLGNTAGAHPNAHGVVAPQPQMQVANTQQPAQPVIGQVNTEASNVSAPATFAQKDAQKRPAEAIAGTSGEKKLNVGVQLEEKSKKGKEDVTVEDLDEDDLLDEEWNQPDYCDDSMVNDCMMMERGFFVANKKGTGAAGRLGLISGLSSFVGAAAHLGQAALSLASGADARSRQTASDCAPGADGALHESHREVVAHLGQEAPGLDCHNPCEFVVHLGQEASVPAAACASVVSGGCAAHLRQVVSGLACNPPGQITLTETHGSDVHAPVHAQQEKEAPDSVFAGVSSPGAVFSAPDGVQPVAEDKEDTVEGTNFPSIALGPMLDRAIFELKEKKAQKKADSGKDIASKDEMVATPPAHSKAIESLPKALRRSSRCAATADEDSLEKAGRLVAKKNLEVEQVICYAY